MADNKQKRGAADRRLIDFNDRDEVMRACRAMRCTELELYLAAVGAGLIGVTGRATSRARIRQFLRAAKANMRELRKSWRAAERKRMGRK